MSVVGIDLGTTNTVVACVRSGKVHVLADEHGSRLLPSVVSFHPNGEVLVGAAAKARRVIDARNTVYSHKRLIGRSWGSPEIAQAKQRFAFELKEGPGQGPLIAARGQDYTLPEISAFVLKRARQIAETALGTPVERAVITVPAHFNELQRASTKVAGRVSGLEVLRILNEPTAAALAYGLGRTGSERVAVYDFGGGTFDCTLLDLNGNVFEVLATAGDSFLGGDDIDNLIAERMAETFLKAHRYDPRSDPQMLERLKTNAEDIKVALSTAESHTVVLKEFGFGAGGSSINFVFTLQRRDLDAMITPLVERSFKVTQDALSLARLSPTGFDKVILVGGTTRVPLVRKRVEQFFGAPPMDRVNPDEVVAIGAAIQAAALTEGARKRSIPAPPPVPGHMARTQPGVQADVRDDTHTSELDPNKMKPAFGSEPPQFGFGPGSSPPQTKSGPPPLGVPGARPQPNIMGGPRKITNPGVAPATQPMGARNAPPRAPASPANDEDPSIASFPDLAVPTPFEWFPSGQPSSGGDTTQANVKQSERSFGGNTITKTGVEQNTLTATANAPSSDPTQPRVGGPPVQKPGVTTQAGFGAIDEPPSLYSTPSASVPSFPSMNSGQGGMPSPIGEPEPFAGGEPEKDQFGAVRDLSLVSSSGVSTPGSPSEPGPFGAVKDLSLVSSSGVSQPGAGSSAGSSPEFGHVSDLSLISNQTATAAMDAIVQARQKAVDQGTFEDDTEATNKAPNKGQVPGGKPAALQQEDDSVDLPAVVPTADLPAVARGGGKGQIRRPAGPALTATGGPSMLGKPPPPVAPQPFGPMEKIKEDEDEPRSRTAAMQGAPPKKPAVSTARAPGGVKPPPAPPTTSPMPARAGASLLGQTAPVGQKSPAAQLKSTQASPGAPPAPPPLPIAQTMASNQNPYNVTEPFGSPAKAPPPQQPPPPAAFAPPPMPQQNPFASAPPAAQPPPQAPSPFASAPPAQAPSPFASAPPPMQQHGGFGSAPPMPPQGYGSGPPPQGAMGSQPPIFGAFSSSPPDPMAQQEYPPPGGGFEAMPPMGQQQSIGYAAPVLVDVTPRALVVETAGGYTDTIIPRNSKIPCERTRRFATGRDMQTTVRVRVAQGEHQFFPQNTYLGEVELSGLRPAPRGEVVVAVTFEVDADGTLRVRARDVQTGQEARAVLPLVGGADESSVVTMINRFAQQPVVGGPTQ